MEASAAADTAGAREGGVVELPRRTESPGGAAGTTGARGVPVRNALAGFNAPRWVMARSLLVPGWGQLHNGSWLKAIGVAAGEGLLASRMVDDRRALDLLDRDVQAARRDHDADREVAAVDAYNRRLDRLIGREWLLGGLLTYALLDAYVDAHFRDFKIEFERDPALPGGGAPKRGARLAVEWAF